MKKKLTSASVGWYGILLSFILLITNPVFAQPRGSFPPPEADKKFVHYSNNSRKNLKSGNVLSSASYAVHALAVAEKKRQLEKSQEALAESMPLAIEKTNRQLNEIKMANQEFAGDGSISRQLTLVSMLMEFAYVREQYAQIPSEKLKTKKGLNLIFDLPDYQPELEAANVLLVEMLQKGAEQHYDQATELEGETSWQQQFERAKHLEKALYYAPNFRDAIVKHQDAALKGTCRMTLGAITNRSRKGNFIAESIRNGIKYDLKNRWKKRPRYFQLIETNNTNQAGANVELEVLITNVFQKNESAEPTTKEHSKKVDDVEVKATSTHYSKSSHVFIEATYYIKDLQTGEVLETDHFQVNGFWNHSWATIRGNLKAVKKGIQNEAKRSDKPFPSLQAMIDETGGGALNLTNQLAVIISKFSSPFS